MFTRRKTKKAGQAHGYWQSYSDMMAALLLMFVLIMAFTLAQSLQTYDMCVQSATADFVTAGLGHGGLAIASQEWAYEHYRTTQP